MPTAETLERFIAMVERNEHAEACEAFYTADASMQENQEPPRRGRAAHVANERRVLARARSVRSQCVRPAFVHGRSELRETARTPGSARTRSTTRR